MGRGETMPGGLIKNKAKSFICSSELSSSIVDDKAAFDILTDLYDRQWNEGDWKSLLKMENFSLKDACVTMLTATNEAHSEEFFVKKDVQGGYFGRTFIIHESKRNIINSLMFPLKHEIDYKKSAEYLRELSLLKGGFTATDEVRHYIDNWYKTFSQARDDQEVKDSTGTLNRFDDSVLKVAMLLSLGRKPELVMEIDTIVEAIGLCEKLVGNVRRQTMGKGKSAYAGQKALLIQELVGRDNHMISRAQLNKKYYLHASLEEWDNIVLQMEAGKILRIESVGNQVVYVMSEVVANEWKKHLDGR